MDRRWLKALGDAEQRYKKRRGITSSFKEIKTVTESRTHGITTTTNFEKVPDKRDPQLFKSIKQMLRQPELTPRQPGEIPIEAIAKMAVEVLDDLV